MIAAPRIGWCNTLRRPRRLSISWPGGGPPSGRSRSFAHRWDRCSAPTLVQECWLEGSWATDVAEHQQIFLVDGDPSLVFSPDVRLGGDRPSCEATRTAGGPLLRPYGRAIPNGGGRLPRPPPDRGSRSRAPPARCRSSVPVRRKPTRQRRAGPGFGLLARPLVTSSPNPGLVTQVANGPGRHHRVESRRDTRGAARVPRQTTAAPDASLWRGPSAILGERCPCVGVDAPSFAG